MPPWVEAASALAYAIIDSEGGPTAYATVMTRAARIYTIFAERFPEGRKMADATSAQPRVREINPHENRRDAMSALA